MADTKQQDLDREQQARFNANYKRVVDAATQAAEGTDLQFAHSPAIPDWQDRTAIGELSFMDAAGRRTLRVEVKMQGDHVALTPVLGGTGKRHVASPVDQAVTWLEQQIEALKTMP
jgi:hypothetical protein